MLSLFADHGHLRRPVRVAPSMLRLFFATVLLRWIFTSGASAGGGVSVRTRD